MKTWRERLIPSVRRALDQLERVDKVPPGYGAAMIGHLVTAIRNDRCDAVAPSHTALDSSRATCLREPEHATDHLGFDDHGVVRWSQ